MLNKLYRVIDDIETSDINKRLASIKEEILNDDTAKMLIEKFNIAKELYERNNAIEPFKEAKASLMNNDLIKRYLEIQNDINLLTMYINNKLSKYVK